MCPLLLVIHVPSIVSILVSTIRGSELELVACFQCVSEYIDLLCNSNQGNEIIFPKLVFTQHMGINSSP